MSDMTPKKAFAVNINQTLWGNSMYVLPDNGLKTEIFTYSASADSITQQDPSLIQLLIPYKISWKGLSGSYSELITVLVVELK